MAEIENAAAVPTLSRKKFSAFISYRRNPNDLAWARWLQRGIETYRVPRALAKDLHVLPRLKRVFRDEDELASGDLSAAIKNALDNSDCLVVVCSRAAAGAAWIDAEVRYFRRDGHSTILALLTEGEPQDSFPPALLSMPAVEGALLDQAQVLAADVRLPMALAWRPRRSRQIRQMALLRIVAGLLGCDFEALRQRERTRRIKRQIYTVAASLALAGLVGALVLRSFNERQNALRRESYQLAAEAREALENDPLRAAQLALSGLPEPGSRWPRPVVSDTEQVLFSALHRLRQRTALTGLDVDVAGHVVLDDSGRTLFGSPTKAWEANFGSDILKPLRPPTGDFGFDAGFVSPNGRATVLTGQGASSLWSVSSAMQQIRRWDQDFYAAAFSPDSRLLATALFEKEGAAWSGKVDLWQASSGIHTASLYGHSDAVSAVRFSPDGRYIATSSADDTVRLWLSDGTDAGLAMKGHSDDVENLAYAPSGRQIASVSSDGTARLFDVQRRDRPKILTGGGILLSAAYNRSGTRLVTVGRAPLRVWDTASGRLVDEFIDPQCSTDAATISADARYVLTPGEAWMCLYEIEAGTVSKIVANRTAEGGSRVRVAGFTPNGSGFVTGSSDGTAGLWRPQTALGWRVSGTEAVWQNAGREFATLAGDRFRLYDFPGRRRVLDRKLPLPGRLLAASADGQYFAADSAKLGDDRVMLWSRNGEVKILPGHMRSVRTVTFNRAGTRLATGSVDRTGAIWDTQTGRLIWRFSQADWLRRAEFSPDEQSLATASDDTVILWNYIARRKLAILHSGRGKIVRFAFSPDRKRLAAVDDEGRLLIWSLPATGKPLMSASFADKPVSVSFNMAADRIIVAGEGGMAQVWILRGGSLVPDGGPRGAKVVRGYGLSAFFGPEDSEIIVTDVGAWQFRAGSPVAVMALPQGIAAAAYEEASAQLSLSTDSETHVFQLFASTEDLVQTAKSALATGTDRRR